MNYGEAYVELLLLKESLENCLDFLLILWMTLVVTKNTSPYSR